MKRLLALLRRHAAAVWFATVVLVALGVASAFVDAERHLPRGRVPAHRRRRAHGRRPARRLPHHGDAPARAGAHHRARRAAHPLQDHPRRHRDLAPVRARHRHVARAAARRVARRRGARRPAARRRDHRRARDDRLLPGGHLQPGRPVDPRELRELAEYVVRPDARGRARRRAHRGARRRRARGRGRARSRGDGGAAPDARRRSPTRCATRDGPRAPSGASTATGSSSPSSATRSPRASPTSARCPSRPAPDGVAIPLASIAEVIDGARGPHSCASAARAARPSSSASRACPARAPPTSSRRAVAAAAALGPTLPAGVTLTPVYDQARLVRESMASVRDAILARHPALRRRHRRSSSATCAPALLAGLTVPLTLAVTFVACASPGQTLNLMSLGGMAVAIGLVVDDAIVMIEAIARHRDARRRASRDAAVDRHRRARARRHRHDAHDGRRLRPARVPRAASSATSSAPSPSPSRRRCSCRSSSRSSSSRSPRASASRQAPHADARAG